MRKLAIVLLLTTLPWLAPVPAAAQAADPAEAEVVGDYHWLAMGAGALGGVVIAGILTPIVVLPALEITGVTAWAMESGWLAGEAAVAGRSAADTAAIVANQTYLERVVSGTTSVLGAIAGGLFGGWAYRT